MAKITQDMLNRTNSRGAADQGGLRRSYTNAGRLP